MGIDKTYNNEDFRHKAQWRFGVVTGFVVFPHFLANDLEPLL